MLSHQVEKSVRKILNGTRGRIRGAINGLVSPRNPRKVIRPERMRAPLAEMELKAVQLRRQNEDLHRARDTAEAANHAKDEFLANVSHEMRTPMNAILGMTELVLDTPLTEAQRQSLRTARSAAGSLLGIINDLLDFSKIEAGKLALDPTELVVREMLAETLGALAVRAHEKGLELVSRVGSRVPARVVGDAVRLRQIITNLVGNAIKFTEEGEIVVDVDVATGTGPEAGPRLRFSIRDTGIGIARDKQEKIFRAFEQEDTSTTRRYGGTGLGLTISGRLVALMDGRLTVESDAGAGSTFSFTARFDSSAADAPGVPEPTGCAGVRALVVANSAAQRDVLGELLRRWGMDATLVESSTAAEDRLADATASARPYALMLLDARLRDGDVPELVAKSRERGAPRVILLIAHDRPGDLDSSRGVRADARLLKPVVECDLAESIAAVLGGRRGGWGANLMPEGGVAASPRSAFAPSLRVLVAEDDDFNAQLMQALLARRGHDVQLARTGRQALRLVEAGGNDLILLDVHMPEFDGFEVIRAIRERERATGGHLPVIAVTARSRREDRERCIAAGMDDYLAKPIGASDLWAAIDRVTRAQASDAFVGVCPGRRQGRSAGGSA